jgi:RNA polymerase sigma-70 factor (ECF subfamily)
VTWLCRDENWSIDDAFLFEVFSPQLFSYFRARRCAPELAEDLTQEVMLKVYRKAGQIRDRRLFRGWLLKMASNTLLIHYDKRSREVATVDVAGVTDLLAAPASSSAGSVPSEFHRWMALLDSRERELMTLRYIEDWEYHEIAAAQFRSEPSNGEYSKQGRSWHRI